MTPWGEGFVTGCIFTLVVVALIITFVWVIRKLLEADEPPRPVRYGVTGLCFCGRPLWDGICVARFDDEHLAHAAATQDRIERARAERDLRGNER